VKVDELPMTFNNKASESALQDALSGRTVRNLAALRNPWSISSAVEALHATRSDTRGGATPGPR
jgi:hypothetical protein